MSNKLFKKGDIVRVIKEPRFKECYQSIGGFGSPRKLIENVVGQICVIIAYEDKYERWLVDKAGAEFSEFISYQFYDDEIELVEC